MVKIVGIATSARKNQATEFFLKEALQAAKNTGLVETQFYSLGSLKFMGCMACDYCKTHPHCSQNDDLYPIIEELKDPQIHGILLATPVYMGNMSWQAKAFLDRSVLFRRQNFLWKNKIGAAIAVGGSRNGGQELAQTSVLTSFLLHDMVLVGDKNPTAHFGGCGWERYPEGYQNDVIALESVRATGIKLAETMALLKE